MFLFKYAHSLYKFLSRGIIKRKRVESLHVPVKNPCRVTLILDLDETLVHSSTCPKEYYDFIVNVKEGRCLQPVFIQKRPGLEKFLEKACRHFEVIIFTASAEPYASKVIDVLCKNHRISGKFYRQHCTMYKNNHVKDLARINRSLDKMVIVDNSPSSWALQPSNGIFIRSFCGNRHDNELKTLWKKLKVIQNTENIPKDLNNIL